MQGYAIGVIGLSLDTFNKLTPYEYSHVYKEYLEREKWQYRQTVELTRWQTSVLLNVHLDKRHKVTPEKLLPLEWDKKTPILDKDKIEHLRKLINEDIGK